MTEKEINRAACMSSPLSSFTLVARKIHSAYARRAPFVAYATFPPFSGGIATKGKAYSVEEKGLNHNVLRRLSISSSAGQNS